MKVLLLGHRGMLAQDVLPALAAAGFTVIGRGRPEVDLTCAASIRQVLADVQPALLLNAAAYTAVDQAEAEPDVAMAVNREGAAHLAAACHEVDIPLLHISTDYVFDGLASRPYREADQTAPLGVYGRSKWAGEQAIRAQHAAHVIVRTSWLYGQHGRNFVKTILRLAREREVLRVIDDQQGCPTWSRDLAQALVRLCHRLQQGRDQFPWGTYHWCGAGSTSWYGLARAIIEEARTFETLRVQNILPIPTTDYPLPAQRPRYSVLDCTKLQEVGGLTPRPWRASLHDCLQELYTCPPTSPVTS